MPPGLPNAPQQSARHQSVQHLLGPVPNPSSKTLQTRSKRATSPSCLVLAAGRPLSLPTGLVGSHDWCPVAPLGFQFPCSKLCTPPLPFRPWLQLPPKRLFVPPTRTLRFLPAALLSHPIQQPSSANPCGAPRHSSRRCAWPTCAGPPPAWRCDLLLTQELQAFLPTRHQADCKFDQSECHLLCRAIPAMTSLLPLVAGLQHGHSVF
mmetsp:Transcript_33768/g.72981  ORF Transcript_33768/g.72981 Transcript_33768/m.72981 type:complete len:207 (-) Transcript_33768:2580-3200(-)